jgi:hypothetical protein
MDQAHVGKSRQRQQTQQGRRRKWADDHQQFQEKHNVTDAEIKQATLLAQLEQAGPQVSLSEREHRASILALAVQMRANNLDTDCLVANVGDSINRIRFRSYIHPCLLPQKKYLYLFQGKASTTCTPSLAMSLQGFGPVEMKKFGLDKLSQKQCQDLCGNAFSANVLYSIMLAVLLYSA